LLEKVAAEYGLAVFQIDAASPAGQRLAQVSGQPRLPAIYTDLELVAAGQPTEEELRQAIARFAESERTTQTARRAES
jgi:hypothetical protein